MKKSLSRLAVAGLTAGLVVTGFVANPNTAHAEPVSASLVAVGSDTLQDVFNALANGTRVTGALVRAKAGEDVFGSFDATGSNNIQVKSSGPLFGRPNGSGDGVTALSRSIDGQPYTSKTKGGLENVSIAGQVDIARSSSGGKKDNNGQLLYVPFGRDALAYAYSGGNAAVGKLNRDQLANLFKCTTTNIGGVQVTPVIPQSGSGSRKDFLSKIGVTDSQLGSCVKTGQEHDTSFLSDGSAFPNNAVTPMSVAQWVAQSTGAGIDRRGNGVKIGSPTGTSPVIGEGKNMTPNKAFYDDSTWGRDVYIVVENARVERGNPRYDEQLASLVGLGDKAGAQTLYNNGSRPNNAGAVKRKFGFLPPADPTPYRAKLS